MNKINKFASTLVEIMILVPIFLFSAYVAVYWGEISLLDINGAVSERYVTEMPYEVTEDEIKSLLMTNSVAAAASTDSVTHYWGDNESFKITDQDKTPGNWPVSEDGSPHNVIHEYFIEYGFDVQVDYKLVDGNIEQEVSYSHPPGGLSLMQWYVYDTADDVVEKVLQERLTYSKSQLDYNYENESPIPGNYKEIDSGAEGKKGEVIAMKKEYRSTIVIDQDFSREFLDEPTSVNRLSDDDFDYNTGELRLSDLRKPENTSIVDEGGGTGIKNTGSQQLYWSNGNEVSTRNTFYKDSKLVLNKDNEELMEEDYEIDFEALASSYENMNFNKDWANGLGDDLSNTVYKNLQK